MGQKINPTGFRVGVIKDWESRWYAGKKDFGNTLISDYELRNYLLSTLAPRRRSEGRNRKRSQESPHQHSLR